MQRARLKRARGSGGSSEYSDYSQEPAASTDPSMESAVGGAETSAPTCERISPHASPGMTHMRQEYPGASTGAHAPGMSTTAAQCAPMQCAPVAAYVQPQPVMYMAPCGPQACGMADGASLSCVYMPAGWHSPNACAMVEVPDYGRHGHSYTGWTPI
jgi:hypothetical protein